MTSPVRTAPVDWPLDVGCCPDWTQLDPVVQARASSIAVELLWALSGRRFGLVPLTVRPVRPGCPDLDPPVRAGLGWWLPWGSLIVAGCGCTGPICGCRRLTEVGLPGPVHDVTRVLVDGVLVDSAGYAVYDHRWLVRLRDGTWPRCQRLDVGDDEAGAFAIVYRRGVPAPAGGQWAAGQYACEVAKACTGDATCRLPRRVASVVRQGVQTTFVDPTQLARDGLTGLPEADAWLRAVNPHRLPRDSVVWSPDLPQHRRRTG